MAEAPPNLTLNIPVSKTTWEQKYAFVRAVQEKLRREHNANVALVTGEQMTEAEMQTYIMQTFRPRQAALAAALGQLRFDPPAAALSEVNLDTDFS